MPYQPRELSGNYNERTFAECDRKPTGYHKKQHDINKPVVAATQCDRDSSGRIPTVSFKFIAKK